jgi:hypothetical protein
MASGKRSRSSIADASGLLGQAYVHAHDLPAALDAINAAIAANTKIPEELYLVPRNLAAKAEIQVALMIFRGILDELSVTLTHARPRLQQAMRNAVLRYLTPVLTESKASRAVGAHSRRGADISVLIPNLDADESVMAGPD